MRPFFTVALFLGFFTALLRVFAPLRRLHFMVAAKEVLKQKHEQKLKEAPHQPEQKYQGAYQPAWGMFQPAWA